MPLLTKHEIEWGEFNAGHSFEQYHKSLFTRELSSLYGISHHTVTPYLTRQLMNILLDRIHEPIQYVMIDFMEYDNYDG